MAPVQSFDGSFTQGHRLTAEATHLYKAHIHISSRVQVTHLRLGVLQVDISGKQHSFRGLQLLLNASKHQMHAFQPFAACTRTPD